MSKLCSRYRQQGVVLPLLAVGMLAIIGVVGLSVDVGHAFLNKTRLQNSLDSAVLSGARTLMLSNDTVAASADARAVFEDHLDGEMADLDAGNLILQYSDTLVPFVAGGSSPRYVRAVFEDFTTDMSFSSVLPDVDGSMSIAGSAVAGPIPVGYAAGGKTCDIAPLLVCGVPGDSNCSDRSCFGYQVGARKESQFSLSTGTESESPEEHASQYFGQQPSACGEGSIFYDCIPTSDDMDDTDQLGESGVTGKFLLNDLGCADNTCIRENLAGSFSSCLTQNASVATEQVTSLKPILQGLMTRFGVYHSSLSAAKYPPDVVVTDRTKKVDYWYDDYKRDVASVIAAGSSNNGGVPYRRVIAVPIVNCQEGAIGQSANTLLGIGCFFLTRAVEVSHHDAQLFVYGQFVSECEASGEQGESVPGISSVYPGPMEIILYKDPDTYES